MNKTIFEGKIVTLNLEQAKLPNGVVHEHEVIHHPGGSSIVPLFENGDVLLLYQYRHPAGKYLWEIPAGKLDIKGEDPKECAARELVEEAGFEAGKIEKVLEFYTSPGFCDEVLHIYKATELREVATNREHHEVIEVKRLAPADVRALYKKGELKDSKTLIGLFACGIL